MSGKLSLTKSITIHASKASVWDALTNPDQIKKYFFGTETTSDFKKGSPIRYKGIWEGKPYEDKGTILEVERNSIFKHNYWSSFIGTPDAPDNYANITYTITGDEGNITLTVTQDNLLTEEAKKHSENNWDMVLDGMKKLLERK